jgi:surface polysaccharide O-acyltransferase-like enzyme
MFSIFGRRTGIFRFPVGNTRIYNFIVYCSGCCFGIYLFHVFGISIVSWCGLSGSLSTHPVAIPAMAVIVFAISFGISAILDKIPWLRGWVV